MNEFPILNGSGDLGIDGDIRPYIGQQVELIKICRSGLYQIRAADGRLFSVPKRNLTELPRKQPVYVRAHDPADWEKAQFMTRVLGYLVTEEAMQAAIASYARGPT